MTRGLDQAWLLELIFPPCSCRSLSRTTLTASVSRQNLMLKLRHNTAKRLHRLQNRPSIVKMPGARVRALSHDAFFYDLRDLPIVLGRLVLNTGVTNANFYLRIDIVLDISNPYFYRTITARHSHETRNHSSLVALSSSLMVLSMSPIR